MDTYMMDFLAKPVRFFAKSLLTVLVTLAVIIGVMWGSQYCYRLVDSVNFPKHFTTDCTAKSSDYEKGTAVLDSITDQMRYELKSTFGWSANDYLFNKYILDNRAYRQFGVYNATKVLIELYSIDIARYGKADKEDDHLFKARQTYFSMSPDRWGMLGFIVSAEDYYEKGLKELDTYRQALKNGTAKYNCTTNDIYTSFQTIISDKLLGYALGLLEDADELPFYTVDNRIYEAQGIALVVRDFVYTIYNLYPVGEKYNSENFDYAMEYLNKICTYNPLYMASTPFNNGAVIRSYLLNARERLRDVAESWRM